MGLLEQLMGGGDRRPDYQDFTNRYDQGQPHEGYDDQEVASRYNEMSGQIDPNTYRASAQQAFEQMTPDDRTQYAQQLHEQASAQGIDTGAPAGGPQSNDPSMLADMTSQVHQQSPGLLGQLLGAGGGMGGGGGGGNPLMKAAMAGITAFAAKKMMNTG